MGNTDKKLTARNARKKRIRRKISGTAERPRLCVYRSTKHIYAQLVDDVSGNTLAAASTLSKELKGKDKKKNKENDFGKKSAAKSVGELIAKKGISAGIESAVFDRGGYRYHGRIKELADAARESGLKF